MPSASLGVWNGRRSTELDQIVAAHVSVGGTGRGRRFATQQLNHAYIVLLSSHFQAFCRDLHSESVDHITRAVSPAGLQMILRAEFIFGRKLDKGNPTPGNIGSDFNRLGVQFWNDVNQHSPQNSRRKCRLEKLNIWRNAIAHQDFDANKLDQRTSVRLVDIRAWRQACNGLAKGFDHVTRNHIKLLVGSYPW